MCIAKVREGQAVYTVGRGPVPRHAAIAEDGPLDRTIARDRPSRYGEKNATPLRRRGPSHATRACERVSPAMQRSRGTGPRATGA